MDLQHAHLGKADEPLLVIDEKIFPPGLLLRDHDGLQVLGDSRARMLLEEAFLATTLRTAEKAEWAFRAVRQDPLRDLLVEEGQIALREALLWIEHALRVCQSHPGNVFAPRFSRDRRHSGRGSRNRNPLDITLERHGAITGRGREAERRPPRPADVPFLSRYALIDVDVLLVEALQIVLRLLPRVAVALPEETGELLELSFGHLEVVIGQFAPLLLDLPAKLLPLAANDVSVHQASPFLILFLDLAE